MDYFGQHLSKVELELRSLKIDPDFRAHESELMDTRWFDYHELHPVQATYLFAHHYLSQYQFFWETYIDIRVAKEKRAFNPADIFMSRDMTAMWKARGLADRMCMPYDVMLRFASKRAFLQLWKNFPRPNQLYAEEFLIDLHAYWKENRATMIRYSRAPGMRASAYRGTFDQVRHVGYVCQQIKARPAPHHNLLRRMFNEDVLTPKLVGDHFPLDEIHKPVG